MNGADVERILADFRDWLTRLPSLPAVPPANGEVDLAAVVGQFTALRQEVNLQTRASRTQLEQNAQALEKLGQAIEVLGEEPEEKTTDETAILRPLLKSLVDARDALALAQKQVVKSRETFVPPPPTPVIDCKLPAWTRWFDLEDRIQAAIAPLQKWADSASHFAANQAMLESLAVGYTMSLQRIDRALEQHGLVRIECVGKPFDPEIMEVVEVVKEASRTGSEVLEDIRPGYRLRGQLFRCAQVRVARS